MEIIPEDITDYGYVNVSAFTLSSMVYVNQIMELRFDSLEEKNMEFLIKIERPVAFTSNIDSKSFCWIRVDGGEYFFCVRDIY